MLAILVERNISITYFDSPIFPIDRTKPSHFVLAQLVYPAVLPYINSKFNLFWRNHDEVIKYRVDFILRLHRIRLLRIRILRIDLLL